MWGVARVLLALAGALAGLRFTPDVAPHATAAAEGADEFVHIGWHHAYLRCEIHRCDTAETRTTDLVPDTVTSMVNLAVLFQQKRMS